MKIAGIITEYNPFHKGHAYQLNTISADFVVAIMSGNFVQRGEPALFDKWTRAEMALANGIDLVLELPAVISTGSAEYFARGAVYLLTQSRLVNQLYFGAEHSSLTDLQYLATLFQAEKPEFSGLLQNYLKEGYSFAASREKAITQMFPNSNFSSILKGSNNILAIEYLKALQYYCSPIAPTLIQRQGQNYLDNAYLENTFLSATAIRNRIASYYNEVQSTDRILSDLQAALPAPTYQILRPLLTDTHQALFPEVIFPFVKMLILRESDSIFAFEGISTDMWQRLKQNIHRFDCYTDFVHACSSRNYSIATIKRALLHIFLNLPKRHSLTDENAYLRVLGFRRSASKLVRKLQESSVLPVITNTRNTKQLSLKAKELYQIELRCDRLYQELCSRQSSNKTIAPEQRNPVIF